MGRKQFWCRQTRVLSKHVLRFRIFNHPQSLVFLWGWKNGSVSLAADETGFPGGWLPDAIHPRSARSCCHSVASCLLRQNGKRNDYGSRHWLELVRKWWYFFRVFQLVYFQGNWAGYSEAAVFTQCHCFLKGCPLPKPLSLHWEGSRLFHHPAAIVWLASTSLL